MPDTIRTRAALLALLADNSSGDISPQDLRDMLVSVMGAKTKFTEEGGLAIKLVNKTGAASVKGSLVVASTGTDEAFALAPITSYAHLGIVYEAGIADGSECWVVISGIAEALVDDSQAVARNDLILSSTSTAGRVDVSAAVPPVSDADHFREVGHAITGCTAGTNQLFKLVLHWN